MSNAIICENLETGIFYCWIQLPAVVVWLVFWLALSPSEDKVVAWKSQAVVRLRRNHFTKCFAKRLPNRSGIRCMVCILLAWEKTPRPWPYFFFLPAPLLSNISWLNRFVMTPTNAKWRAVALVVAISKLIRIVFGILPMILITRQRQI